MSQSDIQDASVESSVQDGEHYQVLPDLADEEYQALKSDIAENGVQVDIAVDEDGKIIDGHHRVRACNELGIEDYPRTVYPGLSDQEKRDLAYKLNLQRRQVDGTTKLEIAKQYLLNDWDGKETQSSIAEKFGCSPRLVRKAFKSDEVFSAKDGVETVRTGPDSIESNGDGTKSSKPTRLRVDSDKDVEKVREVKEKAREGDETANEQWERLRSGDTSPRRAAKEVEKAEAEQAVAEQEKPDTDFPPIIREQDAIDFLESVDSADLVIADPPYSTDVDDIGSFAARWVPPMLNTIGDDGRAFVFIGAYPDELHAYLNVLDEHSALERTNIRVWNYRNTTGKAPKYKYRQNWQAILFIQSDPPTELDAPKKSELSGVQEFHQPHEFGDVEPSQHKWQKPRDLLGQMIRHTSEQGDFVIDPFVGSGSTVLEAARLGRRSLGVDIDTDALETAIGRGCVWEDEQ